MLKYVDYKDLKNGNRTNSIKEFKSLQALPESDPIAMVDRSTKLTFVNQSFKNFFNLEEGQLIGELESVPDIEGVILGLFNSQYSNLSVDLYFPTLNQKTLQLKAERMIIKNSEYISLVFNTVQQKVFLENRVNNLHQALEYSNIPVLVADENGKITYATSSFEKILDLSLEVIYSNSLSSVFSFHLSQEELSRIEEAIRKGYKWNGSISYEDAEKNVCFMDLVLNPINNSTNHAWSFILSGHEITDYVHKNRIVKKSERRLKSIINNISDLLFIVTKHRNRLLFTDANENFCNTFAVDKDIAKDKHIENVFDKEFADKIYDSVENLPKGISFGIEFSFQTKGKRHYKLKMTEIDDNLEVDKIYIISMSDDTERTLYEDQLKKAFEKEYHLNMLKSTFLENMSHEIRTPANAIMGYSEIIEEAVLNREYDTVLELSSALKDVLNRVLNLFNNIIEVSEIESGEINVQKEILDCNKVLRSVFSKKSDEAKNKKLNFYIVLDKGGVFINTDWVKLEKVIYSIVDNAIKYTKTGEVVILSRTIGRKGEIVISDTGDGILKSQLKKILEPFTQEEEISYSRSYEGAGLGLTIAYKLTKLMGGEFYIQSEKKIGTKITINFPLAEPSFE